MTGLSCNFNLKNSTLVFNFFCRIAVPMHMAHWSYFFYVTWCLRFYKGCFIRNKKKLPLTYFKDHTSFLYETFSFLKSHTSRFPSVNRNIVRFAWIWFVWQYPPVKGPKKCIWNLKWRILWLIIDGLLKNWNK